MQPNRTHRRCSAAVLLATSLALPACRERPIISEPTQPPAAAHVAAEHAHAKEHVEHDHSAHMAAAATPLADKSLYHLDAHFTDQAGSDFALSSLRGSLVLTAMFYSSCQSICPMLIAQVAQLEASLPSETRAQTQVLLVSLDPARDTTARLKELAERHQISDPRWHIVRTRPESVRELAALLGVAYRQMPDGEISHSPVLALLDRDGVLVDRMENAAGDTAPLTATIARAALR